MKLVAPPEIGHFDIDNIEYHRDEDGLIFVQLEVHADAMKRLGAVEYVPGTDPEALFTPSVERIQSDFDVELAAKDAALNAANEVNAALMDRLAALEARMAAPPAPAVPPVASASSGDTSGAAGDTHRAADDSDKLAAALATDPDFEEMGRDDMVTWLDGVGVVVPASISKVNARKAIDDTVADYKAGLEKTA